MTRQCGPVQGRAAVGDIFRCCCKMWRSDLCERCYDSSEEQNGAMDRNEIKAGSQTGISFAGGVLDYMVSNSPAIGGSLTV